MSHNILPIYPRLYLLQDGKKSEEGLRGGTSRKEPIWRFPGRFCGASIRGASGLTARWVSKLYSKLRLRLCAVHKWAWGLGIEYRAFADPAKPCWFLPAGRGASSKLQAPVSSEEVGHTSKWAPVQSRPNSRAALICEVRHVKGGRLCSVF